MLHFKPFGKTVNPEFIRSPFLETVKIKIVISLVTTSGNIDFDFTVFHWKAYKKTHMLWVLIHKNVCCGYSLGDSNDEAILKSAHNICFYGELIIHQIPSYLFC